MRRPEVGKPVLLVYRECPCGNWLATGEGAFAPKCHECGGYYVPGGGPKAGDSMFGRDHQEARLVRCLGFAAFLTSEQAALGLVNRLRSSLGFNLSNGEIGHISIEGRSGGSKGEHYTDNERQLASDEIKVATEGEA